MRFERGPELFREEEEGPKDKGNGKEKKRDENERKKGEIKRGIQKMAGRAALGAAVAGTMLPGLREDVPHHAPAPRGDVPHYAPVPHGFDVPRSPEKGLIENLPPGVERIPEKYEEGVAEGGRGRETEETVDTAGVTKEVQAQPEKSEETIERNQVDEQAEQQAEQEQIEIKKFEPSVTVLDININSREEAENFLKDALGDGYVPREQLVKEFGEDFETRWPEVLKKYPMALVHQFFDAFMHHGDRVSDVAEEVLDLTKNYSRLESARDIEPVPLQGIFEETSFGKVEDELGNRGISIRFDEQKIIEALKGNQDKVVNFSFQVGTAEVFVEKRKKITPEPNLNLGDGYYDSEGRYHEIDLPVDGVVKYAKNEEQARKILNSQEGQALLGRGIIFYRGNGFVPFPLEPIGYAHATETGGKLVVPDIVSQKEIVGRWGKARKEAEGNAKIVQVEDPELKIVGAYDHEKAEENLLKLFKVCNAYPDKLFVVAGGNNGEDILGALEKLSGERPLNLIIVAEASGWSPRHRMYGADIYIGNSALEMPEGSSFSTPVISAYAAILFERGLSMEQVVREVTSGHFSGWSFQTGGHELNRQTPPIKVFSASGAVVYLGDLAGIKRQF